MISQILRYCSTLLSIFFKNNLNPLQTKHKFVSKILKKRLNEFNFVKKCFIIDLKKIWGRIKVLKESNEKIRINLFFEISQAACMAKRFNFKLFVTTLFSNQVLLRKFYLCTSSPSLNAQVSSSFHRADYL